MSRDKKGRYTKSDETKTKPKHDQYRREQRNSAIAWMVLLSLFGGGCYATYSPHSTAQCQAYPNEYPAPDPPHRSNELAEADYSKELGRPPHREIPLTKVDPTIKIEEVELPADVKLLYEEFRNGDGTVKYLGIYSYLREVQNTTTKLGLPYTSIIPAMDQTRNNY